MILDVILIIYLVFSIISGYKKGLVGILVHLIGFLIAIVLAFTLNAPVADYIKNNTGVGTAINQNIEKGVNEAIKTQDDSNAKETFYINIVKGFANDAKTEDIANTITDYILRGVSFFVIFILVIIITYIIQMLLNVVFDLPIIGSINKVGGLGVSLILSLFKIWIVLALLSFISPVVPIQGVNDYLKTSIIASTMKNTNIVEGFFSSKLNIKE